MVNKTFFEYLGIADKERIHSQFLAWVFSIDCNSIDSNMKNKLLQDIFQLNCNSQITNILTERNGIDILIETDNEIIVIENKIKSSQHSNQLDNYKKFIEKEFCHKKQYFFFLTLIGEKTENPIWKKITYVDIYKHLNLLILEPNSNHSIIIKEYLIFLKRLVTIVEDFKNNAKNYDMVFLDGSKKKHEKINTPYKNEKEKFIAFNQLETILQKYFLDSLVNRVKSSNGFITDTRGNALVDFPIKQNIEYNGKRYATIIQLQKDTIKFAFGIHGNNYSTSNKKWITEVISKMEDLRKNNNFGYTRKNNPKSKAYISISKSTNGHYWHKNIDELVEYIEKEIENGKSLTNQLIQLIESNK